MKRKKLDKKELEIVHLDKIAMHRRAVEALAQMMVIYGKCPEAETVTMGEAAFVMLEEVERLTEALRGLEKAILGDRP